jgi:preprotein translocase subunit SecG
VLGNLTANRTKAVDEWNDLSSPASEQIIDTGAIPTESVEAAITENSDVPASDTPVISDNNDVPK